MSNLIIYYLILCFFAILPIVIFKFIIKLINNIKVKKLILIHKSKNKLLIILVILIVLVVNFKLNNNSKVNYTLTCEYLGKETNSLAIKGDKIKCTISSIKNMVHKEEKIQFGLKYNSGLKLLTMKSKNEYSLIKEHNHNYFEVVYNYAPTETEKTIDYDLIFDVVDTSNTLNIEFKDIRFVKNKQIKKLENREVFKFYTGEN